MSIGGRSCTSTPESSLPPKSVFKSSDPRRSRTKANRAQFSTLPPDLISGTSIRSSEPGREPSAHQQALTSTGNDPFRDNDAPSPPRSLIIATQAQTWLSQGCFLAAPSFSQLTVTYTRHQFPKETGISFVFAMSRADSNIQQRVLLPPHAQRGVEVICPG